MVWLRFIVMCLLTLALPAQGLAAATMVYCQTASVPASLASSVSTEVMALHADDCPGKTAADNKAENKASGKTACSVCAAACALALPVRLPRLAEPEAAPVAFSTPVLPIAAYEAAGPDRPPRSKSSGSGLPA